MSETKDQPTMTLAEVKQGAHAVMAMPADQAVDMFTERGFALANRIALAYSSSDAVPAQFRSYVLKKSGSGRDFKEDWVENRSAVGNCLVAIEVARACRMSITAVPISMRLVLAPTAASSGNGDASWRAK